MEQVYALLGWGFALAGATALLGIARPIPRLGFSSRKRSLGVLLLAGVGFLNVARMPAEYALSHESQVWRVLLLLLIINGIYQLVRSRKQPPISDESGADTSSLISSGAEVARKTPPQISPATVSRIPAEIKEAPRTKSQPTPPRTERWIKPGDSVGVAGREIDGMIYLGAEPRKSTWKPEGGTFIDPNLPVARVESDLSGESMPYWPSYGEIDPRARATYLDWLAGGRSDKRVGAGYIFLYFYGLERRFFVDSPGEEEKLLLIAEVNRLFDIYADNRSVRKYLGAFLDVAQVVVEPTGDTEPRFEKSGYELPLGVRVAIGRMAKEGQPLTGEWLLGWYIAHPDTGLRTPAVRAFPEFRAMFCLLFDKRYPDGLKLRTPKRLLRAQYVPASASFKADLRTILGEIRDISGTSKPLAIARELVEQATAELDKYSRFLGRRPDGQGTIEAHALLPECLWPLFPCAEIEGLRSWADDVIEAGGLAPVEAVVERLEGAPAGKLGKRHLVGAADALARLSIGMAPDPRFALRSPRLGESVVLFRLPEGTTTLEDVSENYKGVLITIAMGSFIALADGTVAAKERSALEARVDAAGLTEAERVRLLANLQWMLAVPPDLTLFRRRLRDFPENTRHEFGQIALAMAAVDGSIDTAEVKAIERLYRAIGLTNHSIYADLHALAAETEPVAVRAAGDRAREHAIPPPTVDEYKVVLDSNRVASLMADTARVSSVLGDIFRDDAPEEEEEREAPEGVSGVFSGLDATLGAFLGELLTRSQWSEAEFATLASQFQLMQDGALESLNEWSFERFGDALVEVYDGYEVNADVAAKIKN